MHTARALALERMGALDEALEACEAALAVDANCLLALVRTARYGGGG